MCVLSLTPFTTVIVEHINLILKAKKKSRFEKVQPRRRARFSLKVFPNGFHKESSFIVLSVSNDHASYPRYFIQGVKIITEFVSIISLDSVLVDIRFLLWLNVFG